MSAYTDDDVERAEHDYCAWCGWWRTRDDSDEDALLTHIMECENHPLRFGSSKRDALIAAQALRDVIDDLRDALDPLLKTAYKDPLLRTAYDLGINEAIRVVRARADLIEGGGDE